MGTGRVKVYSKLQEMGIGQAYGLGYFLSFFDYVIKDISLNEDVVWLPDPVSLEDIIYFIDEGQDVVVHFHYWIEHNWYRKILKYTKKIVFVSNFQKDILFGWNKGVVLHNGILPERKKINILPTDKRYFDFIFTSRREEPMKGFDTWISKNIKKEDKWVLTGEYTHPQATNLGYLKKKNFRNILNNSKYHVLASLYEPFGLATLQAAKFGCYPVVSKFSGVAELLKESGFGILFNPYQNSIEDIKEMIKERDDVRAERVVQWVNNYGLSWYKRNLERILSDWGLM